LASKGKRFRKAGKMKRQIMAGLVVVGCLAAVCRAETAGDRARTAAWQKSVATAVNDAAKGTVIIQALPESQRGEFATEVLALMQAKRKLVPTQEGWKKDFCATALALLAGACKAQEDVMAAVALAMIDTYKPASGEWTAADLEPLAALTARILAALSPNDRHAMLAAIQGAAEQQKTMVASLRTRMVQDLAQSISDTGNRPAKYQNQENVEMDEEWFAVAGQTNGWHRKRK
jgi:TRAP-type C4-dicarboxylate transport system substrate-binding protein